MASRFPEQCAGRGAPANDQPRRFGLPAREADGDWLDAREALDGAPPPLRTTVTSETPRTIISRNTSPDIGFDRSINPYRGCEHGCIYCFARPTHAFHDLSPGLDFEPRLFAKPDAAGLLRKELAAPDYQCRPIAFGTNTDPYQPIEGRWQITRSCLEVLAETRHPLTITTKSDRVLSDLDLLKTMAADRLAAVAISVTGHLARSADGAHAGTARVASRVAADCRAPPRRRRHSRPCLDRADRAAITDHEIEHLVERAAEAGAMGVSFIPVRPCWRVHRCRCSEGRRSERAPISLQIEGGRDAALFRPVPGIRSWLC